MFSLVGEKVGMTQLFSESGNVVAATAIKVNPNLVVGIYKNVVSIGYGEIRESLVNKPNKGQYKKNSLPVKRHIYSLKGLDPLKFKPGDLIRAKDQFKPGDLIDIQGVTRGHGFTGAIKLWNFSCGPRTHGAGYPHRFTGSLETGRGGSSPQKVWKGKKMAGRYGHSKVSISNLEILFIDESKELIFVKGAVPGRKGSVVKLKITTRSKKKVGEPFKLFTNEKN